LQVSLSNGWVVYAYVNDECESCGYNDLNLGIPGFNDVSAFGHTLIFTHINTLSHRVERAMRMRRRLSPGQYHV
jgi:hypothetical protein